jgi:hypothetical protein
MMTKILAGGAGLAALATAAPASAQYYPYGYSNPSVYGAQYGYRYNSTALAQQQCTAAVQARLNNRTSLAEIFGSLVGLPTNNYGRVVSITRVDPNRSTIRVRGLASSGRMAYNGYGAYGVGAYGALGYAYQPDLRFRCDVDYRGYVRDVDIDRR